LFNLLCSIIVKLNLWISFARNACTNYVTVLREHQYKY